MTMTRKKVTKQNRAERVNSVRTSGHLESSPSTPLMLMAETATSRGHFTVIFRLNSILQLSRNLEMEMIMIVTKTEQTAEDAFESNVPALKRKICERCVQKW